MSFNRSSDGAPESDGALQTVIKYGTIVKYTSVDTSGRIYDDFSGLLFLHAHREASALAHELSRNPFISDSFVLLV